MSSKICNYVDNSNWKFDWGKYLELIWNGLGVAGIGSFRMQAGCRSNLAEVLRSENLNFKENMSIRNLLNIIFGCLLIVMQPETIVFAFVEFSLHLTFLEVKKGGYRN